jgi:hypothetical protein
MRFPSHKAGKIELIDPVTDEVVALFNPRTQVWAEHFAWAEDGICILGKTPTGRATVRALSLDNDFDALEVRSYWVQAGLASTEKLI